jgi:LysM repeat protein
MNARRLVLYLLLNAVVSISATWLALWIWENYISPRAAGPRTVASAPAPTTAPGFPAQGFPGVIASPLPTLPSTRQAAGPVTHVVQSGDTLGSIAQQYDLSIEALMELNSLTDPNRLDVGQTLIVGIPPTAPPTEAPPVAPLPTATPDPNVPAPSLTIREVRSAGVLAEEVVVIANAGGPVDLAGWTLRDETGRAYTFPALTLFEGGIVNVHTRAGEDSVIDLYWGLGGPAWRAGQLLLLTDPNGNLSARYSVP